MVVVVTEKGGSPKRLEFQKAEITIGRVQGNDIVLPKGNVSKQHSRIMMEGDKLVIIDLKSTNGTYVNNRKIAGPQVVQNEDKIYIGDFMIQVEGMGAGAQPPAPAPVPMPMVKPTPIAPPMPPPEEPRPMPPMVRPAPVPGGGGPPAPVVRPMGGGPGPMANPVPMGSPSGPSPMGGPGMAPARPVAVPQPAASASGPGGGRRPPAATMALDAPQERRLGSAAAPVPTPMPPRAGAPSPIAPKTPEPMRPEPAPVAEVVPLPMPAAAAPIVMQAPQAAPKKLKAYFEPPIDENAHPGADRLRARAVVLERLGEQLDLTDPGQKGVPVPETWESSQQQIGDLVQQLLADGDLSAGLDLDRLIQETRSEALAIGPLDDLLQDEEVSEIFVNGPHQILTVRNNGETRLEENAFATELGLLCAIDRLLRASGRNLDPDATSLDLKLRDGTRITATFPPLSSKGTTMLLKKGQGISSSLADLVGQGVLPESAAGFLEAAVRERRTVLVSGGFGAGQGLLLSALSQLLAPEERVALIEDSAELTVYHTQLMQFEARGALSLAHVLRFGATRLIIPNVLSLNPADVATALHSGIDGALLGSVGQGIDDTLDRLAAAATLSLPGTKAPLFREMFARAIPVFVFINRFSDGSRRVIQIAEIGEDLSLREVPLGDAN